MIGEDTTNTVKCASCGALVPVAALLCPGCGKPNVSSAFASPGSSWFAPSTGAQSPDEQAPAPAPPVEEPPLAETARHQVQFAPPRPARTPSPDRLIVDKDGVTDIDTVVRKLQSDLDKLDREWTSYERNYRAERIGKRISLGTVGKGLLWLALIGLLYAMGFALLASHTLYPGVLVGAPLVVCATYLLSRPYKYFTGVYQHDEAHNRYLASRREILSRLSDLRWQGMVDQDEGAKVRRLDILRRLIDILSWGPWWS